eukprot:GHRQ01023937.1.p1 GENE.GHRQ01023937.1~~GHRQ01023937.1.p1  ORF type:complete len:113 (-),score=13.63 GHRQ01023937.1:746-1051(-)
MLRRTALICSGRKAQAWVHSRLGHQRPSLVFLKNRNEWYKFLTCCKSDSATSLKNACCHSCWETCKDEQHRMPEPLAGTSSTARHSCRWSLAGTGSTTRHS